MYTNCARRPRTAVMSVIAGWYSALVHDDPTQLLLGYQISGVFDEDFVRHGFDAHHYQGRLAILPGTHSR